MGIEPSSHEDEPIDRSEFEWSGQDLPTPVFVPMVEVAACVVNANDLMASAVYDFIAWMTTRPEIVSMGASENCVPVMDAYTEWSATRGLNIVADGIIPNIGEFISARIRMDPDDPLRRDIIIQRLLGTIRHHDQDYLQQIIDELKESDGEHWAVGELLERAAQYLNMEMRSDFPD